MGCKFIGHCLIPEIPDENDSTLKLQKYVFFTQVIISFTKPNPIASVKHLNSGRVRVCTIVIYLQEFKGIRQWPINRCTFPIMIQN